MKPNMRAPLIVLRLLVLISIICGCWWSCYPQIVILRGNTPRVLQWAQLVAPVGSSTHMKAVVWLRLRNEDELNRLLKRQADPGSADYQVYLKPEEFAARFAPSPGDYARLVDYFQCQGLTVTSLSPNRLILSVQGDAEHMGLAFGTDICKFQYRGASFISNKSDPVLPSIVGELVVSIAGLNNLAKLEDGPKAVPVPPVVDPGSKAVPASPVINPGTKPAPASPGIDFGPIGLTPEIVATAYNFPNPNNIQHGRYTGKGRKIAIVSAKGFNSSDVEAYWQRFSIKRTGAITVKQFGGQFKDTHLETTTDVELLGAQVPDADIIVYEAKEWDTTYFELALNQLVVDNEADVVSMSVGAWEDLLAATNSMVPQNSLFKQAKAQGIAFFCSSGDRGAYDDPQLNKLMAHYPASDPNVVSVGATTLSYNLVTGERRETAWIHSGGAVSEHWAQPAWQYGPGVPANGKRNTCDVSFAGDAFKSAYAAFYNGYWTTTGATSAATPNWAALWLLAEQAAGRRIGDANELIYEIGRSPEYPSIFYDITVGSNGDTRGPGFDAGPGWDHPTGWGSPNGAALVEWMRLRFHGPMLPDLPPAPKQQKVDPNVKPNLPKVHDPLYPNVTPTVKPSLPDDPFVR